MKVRLHCSASKFGNAIMINDWHVNGNGWKAIGYHVVILNGRIKSNFYNSFYDGLVETGRAFDENDHIDIWEMGAHTKGENDSIGICLIGNSGDFTPKQIESLEETLMDLKKMFGTLEDISQHSDHDKSKPHCAGFNEGYMRYINKLYGYG
jgi:hypothetical protein